MGLCGVFVVGCVVRICDIMVWWVVLVYRCSKSS